MGLMVSRLIIVSVNRNELKMNNRVYSRKILMIFRFLQFSYSQFVEKVNLILCHNRVRTFCKKDILSSQS